MSGLGTTLAPRAALKSLVLAKASGIDTDELLDAMAAETLEESNQKTSKSVRSGLLAWHGFAVDVLGYDPELTLPPLHDGHVLRFISIFRCGATAANYVGYIRWGCIRLRLSTAWKTETVCLALAGAKKQTTRRAAGVLALTRKFVLHDLTLKKVVMLSRSMCELQTGLIFVFLYEFLLRVQSEGCLVHAGCDAYAVYLPDGIDAVCWINPKLRLAYLRLRCRKNRPAGSLLTRPCTCSLMRETCAYHAIEALTKAKVVGSILWSLTPHELLRSLRRFLILLHVDGGAAATLKCFRAGKACSLAARGEDIKLILELGEWKSRAVMKYLNAEAVDDMAILNASIDASDDDDEVPEPSPKQLRIL